MRPGRSVRALSALYLLAALTRNGLRASAHPEVQARQRLLRRFRLLDLFHLSSTTKIFASVTQKCD